MRAELARPAATRPRALPLRVAARLDRLLTWKRACTYAGLLLILYGAAWGHVLTTGHPPLNGSGEPLVGDYIAFHAAGRLVLSGHAADLYDHSALAAVQDDLLGGSVPNFYDPFRNPPFFALLYVPFAPFDLLTGFGAYSVLSLGLLALGVWLLLDEVPALRPRWRGLVILVFAFPPVYFGLINGENATLSLLMYVLLYRAFARAQPRTAGVVAALGLFKPQLFFIFPFVFVARRQWRSLVWYTLTALGLSLISLLLVDPQGLQGWLRVVVDMEAANAQANAWRMVSLKSFFDSLLPGQTEVALALSSACAVLLLTALYRQWRSPLVTLPSVWMLTCLTATLVDPHLVDYDLSVLVTAIAGPVVAPNAVRWLVVWLMLCLLFRAAIPIPAGEIQLSSLALATLMASVWYTHHYSAWILARYEDRM